MILKVYKELKCPEEVIKHSKVVRKRAVELASKFPNQVDTELIETGALLHDVGRCSSNNIQHAIIGAQILKNEGFSPEVVKIVERHIGAGISPEEALTLGLPPKDYTPQTLEEKIVAHADNLVHGDLKVGLYFVLNKWKKRLGPDHPSLEKLKRLHHEVAGDDFF
ncbi:MAG TPA: TIGR00295 family protein [Methanobacteriaceae archaeon]|nr:TIGR00295 family protein [Methanobacteriaceae archaeon]